MDQQAEKRDSTERETGLGKRTREEIVQWNQTSDIPSLPSWDNNRMRGCVVTLPMMMMTAVIRRIGN